MIKLICDRCGKECGLNAFDVRSNVIHNPVPTSIRDVGEPKLSACDDHIRFMLCSDCYNELGLPNPYEKELKFE